MRILATIVLALIVLIAGLLFLASSICAFGMAPNPGSLIGGTVAIISGAVTVGGIALIAHINKKQPSEPTHVTPQQSVPSSNSHENEHR